MASSSRPFQSQTVNRLLGTYYAWSQRLSRAKGWLGIGAVWAVQVALYPVYVAFQGGRVLYRRVAAADPVGRVISLIKPKSSPIQAWLQAKQSDGAIQVLLGWLQQPASPLFEAYLPQAPRADQGLAAQSAGFLASANLPQLPRSQRIQGIATDLATQTLVLVGQDNQLLDVLSAAEQATLDRAIRWLLSEQRYQGWRQKQQLTAGRLPLPSPNRRAWWPIQLFQHLMRWMTTSPVALSTNLFGESELVTHLRRSRLLQSQSPPRRALPGQSPIEASISRRHPATASLRSAPTPSALAAVATPAPVAAASTPTIRSLDTLLDASQVEALTVSREAAPQLGEEPAWIEAKATVVSYVQHPLVTVLRWIDLALSQMEKVLQDTWQWVRSHITF